MGEFFQGRLLLVLDTLEQKYKIMRNIHPGVAKFMLGQAAFLSGHQDNTAKFFRENPRPARLSRIAWNVWLLGRAPKRSKATIRYTNHKWTFWQHITIINLQILQLVSWLHARDLSRGEQDGSGERRRRLRGRQRERLRVLLHDRALQRGEQGRPGVPTTARGQCQRKASLRLQETCHLLLEQETDGFAKKCG